VCVLASVYLFIFFSFEEVGRVVGRDFLRSLWPNDRSIDRVVVGLLKQRSAAKT
jgi:hypothetical protein